MVEALFESQRPQFAALAENWLLSGARSFSIWNGSERIALWPMDGEELETSFAAKIRVGAQYFGELRISGVIDSLAQTRLRNDAKLVSNFLLLDRDLRSMTFELIDTRDQFLALANLTQATRNCLEIEETLKNLTYESTRLMKSEAVSIYMKQSGKQIYAAHYPGSTLPLAMIRNYFDELKAKDGQHLLISDTQVNWPASLRNLLLLPIQVRESEIAALCVFNKLSGEFMSPDIKLAAAIVDYAGAQIENVILAHENLEKARLETELELAHRVQNSLLPKQPPQVAGLDIWADSRQALQVGGDFFDFIANEAHPFTFIVGDISGKGMPAALLMAMTRTILRSKLNGIPITSEDIIARANRDLYIDFGGANMFATVFVGQYDPDEAELCFANAGHSPVIYRPVKGKAQLLQADGPPMGILQAKSSRDQLLEFKAGDVLLVGSDGLNDARNVLGERYGYDRLLEIVDTYASRSAKEIADRLLDAVGQFASGARTEDDRTVLILKGTG